jgi:aryl-alcohol dehydrogenase-like predicted oxidoreductase
MKYQLLGSSDLQVSEVGFGCMSLGRDHAHNETLLRQAFDGGVTFFDTADLYDHGENEISVGKALKDVRDEVVIATKVGNRWLDDSSWTWDPSPEHIRSAVDHSLERLGVDVIDLYQLHGGTIDDPIDEGIATFEDLKQEGKIRYYGISSIRPNVIREYAARANLSSVMLQYSLLDRRPEETVLDLLKTHNIGVIARGPVAKGLLSERKDDKLGRLRQGYLAHDTASIDHVRDTLAACSNEQRNHTQTALRFVLEHPVVTTTIPGASQLAQLQDNLAASDAPALGEAYARLQGLTIHHYDQHR